MYGTEHNMALWPNKNAGSDFFEALNKPEYSKFNAYAKKLTSWDAMNKTRDNGEHDD